jgi:hypothetical protein
MESLRKQGFFYPPSLSGGLHIEAQSIEPFFREKILRKRLTEEMRIGKI